MRFTDSEAAELKSRIVGYIYKEVIAFANKITLPTLNFLSNTAPIMHDLTTDEEETILSLIDDKGYIVRSDVDKLLGVSQATSSRILKRMIDKGFIVPSGTDRNRKYIRR